MESDVLIAGGGLVGGTLAAALGGAGLRVTVIEPETETRQVQAAFDGRASAIALGPQRMLRAVGLWDMLSGQAAPILDIRVSEGGSPFFCHYSHEELGGGAEPASEPFGYMLENRLLRQAIFRRLSELDCVRLMAPARIAMAERGSGGVEARLDTGQNFSAPLIIGAEGRGSPTRQAAGIRLTKWSYQQTGIVCTVAHEKSHQNVAHEHFLPAGPFAILPLPGNFSSIVWSERDRLAARIMEMDEADFHHQLARRFGDFLGEIKVIGPRSAYPFSLQFAHTSIARRLALVGDAAHGMHPIAGQGMNMGLRDVAALAEILVDAKRGGLDLGGAGQLLRYQRWRRFDNMQMLLLTDGLLRLFSNDFAPLRALRGVGLAAVNRAAPVKRFFMRHAMGLVGDLPRLLRGEAL
jgi:2-octaprenyl-6-methoxyphenol hydroxylase